MSSSLDNVKDKIKSAAGSSDGLLTKIQNFFGMGYADKENLRELDKKLRDSYYQAFKGLRHRWEEVYLAALEAGKKGDDFKKVIQVTDRLAEKINRADYGYAGLFDRKGSIREVELTKAFELDKSFSADISFFSTSIDEVYADYEAEAWDAAMPKVKKIRSLVLDLEKKWDSREQQFRPVGV
ncbi:MAG TPA: hypothetical protein P5290_02415 [Candidatus Methanomethylicus sp.]|mgnify:CR=1 FL=1|nr:hypothetical protein [Candidatus Methanomethylicus sp.]HRR54180.1 hypothetical protein [Candidatus Methanomethylicus sp.]